MEKWISEFDKGELGMFSIFIEWGGQLVLLARGYTTHDAAEWAIAQWCARHGIVEAMSPFHIVAEEADAPDEPVWEQMRR